MLPFLSPVLLFALCSAWIFWSPTDILEAHPRLFYFMVGTAFANISCRLIVCQMSSTRCQPLNILLLPLALAILAVVSGVLAQQETLLLYLLTCLITAAHIHYGVSVAFPYSLLIIQHFASPFMLDK
uniref:Uncharacterized protein n=1 Tax=Anolis carolinensis TaxID=28377 RepID=H9GJ16_ANOCA